MQVIQLLGNAMGLALVAGINLYATILTVGLGIRFDFIQLPTHLDALSILAHPYVLIAAVIAYTLEFFADKIPWVDSLWDSIHTFIRPFGAAVLGINAIGAVDPAIELSIFLLCGGIALSTHSTKASIRLAVNHSPEPFSNSALSVVEDITVVGGTWFALTHPLSMFFIAIFFVAIFIYFAPKIFRIMRLEFLAILAISRAVLKKNNLANAIVMFDNLPSKFSENISEEHISKENNFCIRCFSGKGLNVGRNYMGFLCKIENRLFFLTRKHFRIHKIDFDISEIKKIKLQKKLFFDCLTFNFEKQEVRLHVLKDKRKEGEKIIKILESVSSTDV